MTLYDQILGGLYGQALGDAWCMPAMLTPDQTWQRYGGWIDRFLPGADDLLAFDLHVGQQLDGPVNLFERGAVATPLRDTPDITGKSDIDLLATVTNADLAHLINSKIGQEILPHVSPGETGGVEAFADALVVNDGKGHKDDQNKEKDDGFFHGY